jgi:cytidyltransferase-like protein
MKISVVSGGFDPIHSGHIEYIKSAKNLGEKLIVALNSNEWLLRKKGNFFLPFKERKIILESLKYVDEVIDFKDDDGSCSQALEKIKTMYPDDQIIFCNGGDRNKNNIPEQKISGVNFAFSVGGEDKKNSSSSILKNWKFLKENRNWGKFYEIFKDDKVKVKELIINPKNGMSLQRHFHRGEIWFVSKGNCIVNFSKADHKKVKEIPLKENSFFQINKEDWHQLINPYNEECRIIEIQYGERLEEEDIERQYYFDKSLLD